MFLDFLKNNRYAHLLGGSLILLAIILFNGTHGIYLFDTAIVYNYGYLLHQHLAPFKDFTSPLLPFPGLLQNICYSLFGVNYMSGVYGAAVVMLFQYITLYILFYKILGSNFKALGYAFAITICCMPVMGMLFYNYMVMAFITIHYACSFYLYFKSQSDKKHYATVALQYAMVALVFTTKLQFGAYLIAAAVAFDFAFLMFLRKNSVAAVIKSLAFRLLIFFVIVAAVLLVTKSDLKAYLLYAKSISLLHNLARFQILGFLGFPSNPGIAIAPTLLFVMFLLYYFNTSKKHTLQDWFFFLFVANIYLLSFIVIMFSQESYTIVLIPLSISIMILFETVYSQHQSLNATSFFNIAFRPTVLLMVTVYFACYSLISIRKSYVESTGEYPIYLSIKNKYSFGSSTPELQHFFNHIKVYEQQYHDYTALDSTIKANPSKKVFFGPDLDMLNIVYQLKPQIQWPVWIHPYLTVTPTHMVKMERDFKAVNYDLIVLSKLRHITIPFIPFLADYLKSGYTQVNSGSDWILVYKRNTAPVVNSATTARQ